MAASSEATAGACPVSSFLFFGKPVPLDPPRDQMSEPPAGSFEACELVVDDLVGDDDASRLHPGDFASLRVSPRRTTVEETTGRLGGFFGLNNTRHTLPSERVPRGVPPDVGDLHDARGVRDPREFSPFGAASNARYTGGEDVRRVRDGSTPRGGGAGGGNPGTGTPFFPSSYPKTSPKATTRSAPPSPFVPRRSTTTSSTTHSSPLGSPSPLSPLDWSSYKEAVPAAAARPPVTGDFGGASNAFAAFGATALCRFSGTGVDSTGIVGLSGKQSQLTSSISFPERRHLGTAGTPNGNGFRAEVNDVYAPARRARSCDFAPARRDTGSESAFDFGETRGEHTPCSPCDRGPGYLSHDQPFGGDFGTPQESRLASAYDRQSRDQHRDEQYACDDDSYDDDLAGPDEDQNDADYDRALFYYQQNALYKTELCRSWEETGQCRYGSKCQFAHTRGELRPVMRHPKYKTETCRTFLQSGACPYGTRCRFIHYRVPHLNKGNGTLTAHAHDVILEDWGGGMGPGSTRSPQRRTASLPSARPGPDGNERGAVSALEAAGHGVGGRHPQNAHAASFSPGGGGEQKNEFRPRRETRSEETPQRSRLPVFREMESRPAAREVSPQTVLSARKARVQHENKHEYVVESEYRDTGEDKSSLEKVARHVALSALSAMDVADDGVARANAKFAINRAASAAATAQAVRGGHKELACGL